MLRSGSNRRPGGAHEPAAAGRWGIFQRGGAYWLKYYRAGLPIRESVAQSLGKSPGDVTEGEARRLLKQRVGKIANGEPIALGAERVRVGELLDDLLTEYRINGRRSIRRATFSVAHLRRFFDQARA